MTTRLILVALIAMGGAAGAYAQGTDDAAVETLDVTMTLMPEGATLPDAVTKVIELPASASDTARQNSARGLDTANAARENRAAGLDTAAEARENGREFGQQMREQAQANREDAGRGNRPDTPTPDPPGLPGELPGPPNAPGRP